MFVLKPDCEELVGVTQRRWWGWFWGIHFFNTPLCQFTNGFSQLWYIGL